MKAFSKLIKNGKSSAFLSVVLVTLIALLLYFIYGRRLREGVPLRRNRIEMKQKRTEMDAMEGAAIFGGRLFTVKTNTSLPRYQKPPNYADILPDNPNVYKMAGKTYVTDAVGYPVVPKRTYLDRFGSISLSPNSEIGKLLRRYNIT